MRNVIPSGLVVACAIFAQPVPGAPEQKIAFEVASARPSPPPNSSNGTVTVMGLRGGPGSTDPERMSRKIDLRNALLRAFGVPYDQLTGPDWMQTERYDFSAIVPPGTTPEQFNVMLQNLLVERFKITMHTAKKDFAVYEVVVAKGGLKMKPSTAEPAPPPAPRGPAQADPAVIQAQVTLQLAQLRAANGPGSLDKDGFPTLSDDNRPTQRTVGTGTKTVVSARGQNMASVVNILQGGMGAGARMIDKTGVTGLYDFKLRFSPPAALTAAAPADPEDAPDLVTAAQSQLGLKLEKTTAPFDVLVIDHIEKTPTDN
jgi:uncharacterized protein (TIGR03435 family)